MLKENPEINSKFADFYRVVFKEGNLSLKIKELVAIGVALGGGCDPCYEFHLEKAKKAGATDQEIREAIGVAEVLGVGKIREIVYGVDEKSK